MEEWTVIRRMNVNRCMSSMMGYIPYWVRYDKDLTAFAKLLYAELTANSNNNKVTMKISSLSARLKKSERYVQMELNSLADKGYIFIEGEKGRRVIIIPERKIETVTTVKYMPDTSVSKEDMEFFARSIDFWNKNVDARLKLTGGLITKFRARLRTFSKEDITEALTNRIKYMANSPWHLKEENRKHKINIELVLRNDEELDKWLNTRVNSTLKHDTSSFSEISGLDITE